MTEVNKIQYPRGGVRPKGSSTRTEEEIIKIFDDKGLKLDRNQEIKNNVKLLAYTEEGYKIEGKATRIEQGVIPYIVGRDTPYSIWNIRNIWLPKNAPDYELLDNEYVNTKHKMTWRLKDSHLPDFKMTWGNFQRIKRHPTLGRIIGSDNKKISSEDMLKIISERLVNHKGFSGWELVIEDDYEYIDLEDIFIFKDKDGYLGCQTASAIRIGYSPQKYISIYPITSTYNLYLWDELENKNERLLEGQTYVGSNKAKYKFICETHGIIEKWMHDAFNNVKCRACVIDATKGENHPNWDSSKTAEERDDKRQSAEYREWVKKVYERDNYTCQCCGSKEAIAAHHKDGFGWCIERRTDITNGVSLCKGCHVGGVFSFHHLYGNGSNTEDQFNEWLAIYQPIIINLKNKEVI